MTLAYLSNAYDLLPPPFQLPHIQYDISDLNAYIDTFADLTAMVLDHSTKQFQGVSKANIKKGILANLTRKAGL